jgi:hypothetical protein
VGQVTTIQAAAATQRRRALAALYRLEAVADEMNEADVRDLTAAVDGLVGALGPASWRHSVAGAASGGLSAFDRAAWGWFLANARADADLARPSQSPDKAESAQVEAPAADVISDAAPKGGHHDPR